MTTAKNFPILLIVSVVILNKNGGYVQSTKDSSLTTPGKCSNFEVNYDYQHFIFLYKDNVYSVEECCAFCNSNERCIVWSLQAEIGRCYLKYDRGVKVFTSGFTSGFSNSYYAQLSTSQPFTTTPKITTTTTNDMSTVSTTTIGKSTTTELPQLLTCDEINGVEFGETFSAQATNTSLAMCCDFCSQYNLCKMYTFYPETKRCLLFDTFNLPYKYCKVPDECQSGKIFMTTTRATTVSVTKLPSLYMPQLNSFAIDQNAMCYYENSTHYFSSSYLSEFYNSNLSECCEKCQLNELCLSWSLYPTNLPRNSFNCRLYDTFRQNPQATFGFQSGFNLKSTGFGFYSVNDRFQLKFFDLTGNYTFLNYLHVYDTEEQQALIKIIQSIETNIKEKMLYPLKDKIFKIIVDNISYLRTRQSIIASFIVVLDPRINDLNNAEGLLNQFNYLIDKNMGFDEIKIYNESSSNSSLLPNLSSFTLRTINMQRINDLSYLNDAIKVTTTIQPVTTIPITTPIPTTSTTSTTTTTTTTIPTTTTTSTTTTTTTTSTTTPTTTTSTTTTTTPTTTTTTTTSTTTITSIYDELIDLRNPLSSFGKCYTENNTVYLGPNIEELTNVETMTDCCNACVMKINCKSWVYSHLYKKCTLKEKLRSGLLNLEYYSSGFVDNKIDSFLKISRSLGFVNFDGLYTTSELKKIKGEAVDSIQLRLTNLWKGLLRSNIADVKLVDLELNPSINTTTNPSVLILSFVMELDKRIAEDMDEVAKISRLVNTTLMQPNTRVYSEVAGDFESAISFVLRNYGINFLRIDKTATTTTKLAPVTRTTTKTFQKFSLYIRNGLKFLNVNNSMYSFLQKLPSNYTTTEVIIYNAIDASVSKQIKKQMNNDLNNDYITNVSISSMNFIMKLQVLNIDYQVDLNPNYVRNEVETKLIQAKMNELFATSNYSNNSLLRIKLPFINMNGLDMVTTVPESTSQFQLTRDSLVTTTTTTVAITTDNIDAFEYIGCFNDSQHDRDLNFTGILPSLVDENQMTIKLCVDHCRFNMQPYAGLQFGKECFCGDNYGRFGQLSNDECFYYCTGDTGTKCGGIGANAIYKTGIEPPSTNTTTISSTTTETKSTYLPTGTTFKPLTSSTSKKTSTTPSYSTTNELTTISTSRETSQLTNAMTSTAFALTPLTNATYFAINSTANTYVNRTTSYFSFLFNYTNESNTTTGSSENTTTFYNLVTDEYINENVTDYINNNGSDNILSNSTELTILSNYTSKTYLSTQPSFNLTNFTSGAPYLSFPFNGNASYNLSVSKTSRYTPTTTFFEVFKNISNTTGVSPINVTQNLLENSTFSLRETSTINIRASTSTMLLTTNASLDSTYLTSQKSLISTLITLVTTFKTIPVTSVTKPSFSTSSTTTSTVTTSPVTSSSQKQTPITMPASTSSGILPISLPSDKDYLITKIRVDKSVDVQAPQFRLNITDGLREAYSAAFLKAYSVFINRKLSRINSIGSLNVKLVNVTRTGKTNPENTKNEVKLKYYVLNDNKVINGAFAADSINLISKQDMSRYLNNEIVEQGYVEKAPYKTDGEEDLRLWIIGAVLGPITFIVALFWIIAFVYYKCINPKRKLDKKKGFRLNDESSDTSQVENIQHRRSSKVKPETIQEAKSSKKVKRHAQSEKPIFSSSTHSPSTLSEDSPPPKPKKPLSKKKSIINTLNTKVSDTDNIQESIRQKSELERWRNKQRNRERESVDHISIHKTPENIFYSSAKITPVNIEQQEELSKKPPTKPIIQPPQSRSDISIISNDSFDFYSVPVSQNNLILSEDSKSYLNSKKKAHKPVKVHVEHKPNRDETSRVYNPYQMQNEYEQYSKNGFLFEPINTSNNQSILNNSNVNKADAVFNSQAISPYIRRDTHSIDYKKPVNNDKVSDIARGYANSSYKYDSSTEFQNLNNLKNTSGYRINKSEQVSRVSYLSNNEGVDNTSLEQIREVHSQRAAEQMYEDEYDIANKFKKNKDANQSIELINSINTELQRMKQGYRDPSNL